MLTSGPATLIGAGGGDAISAIHQTGPVVIFGGGGADGISASNGDDLVYGGAGADAIYGFGGNDELHACGAGASGSGNAVYGQTGDDQLFACDGDLLSGGAGADELRGGPGDDELNGDEGPDVIYPGGGVDAVDGGSGDDLIVLGSGCELEPGLTLNGGPGQDTLETPLTLSQLDDRGIVVTSIENIVLIQDPLCGVGACELQDDIPVCECPAGWVGDYCQSCDDDHHFKKGDIHANTLQELFALQSVDFDLFSLDLSGVECVPDASCSGVDCGPNGVCREADNGQALCACDTGWTGAACDRCDPPWQLDAGECILARECRDTMCGGNGSCVNDDTQRSFACVCDAGHDGPSCRGLSPRIEPSAFNGKAGTVIEIEFIDRDPACSGTVDWQITQGLGANLTVNTPTRATMSLGSIGAAKLVTYEVEVTDGSCPPVQTWISAFSDDVQSVAGRPHIEFENLDRRIIDRMLASGAPGIVFAMTESGRIVYSRAYGVKDIQTKAPMLTDTRVRMSSMTKPITAAAVRNLDVVTSGMVSLDDSIFDAFSIEAEVEAQLQTQVDGSLIGAPSIRAKVADADHNWRLNVDNPTQVQIANFDAFRDGRISTCLADPDEVDPLWLQATVNHQITHNNGTSRDLWGELAQMFDDHALYVRPSAPPPFSTSTTTAHAVRTCLFNTPGFSILSQGWGHTRDYSSSGYALLGSIAASYETSTGSIEERYAEYVMNNVLQGLDGFHLASSKRGTQHPDEPTYYDQSFNVDQVTNFIDGVCCPESDPNFPDCASGGTASCSNGVWNFEQTESAPYARPFENRVGSGGWVGTACGVASFANRFDRVGNDLRTGATPFTSGAHTGANSGNGGVVEWVAAADSANNNTVRGDVAFGLITNFNLNASDDIRKDLDNLREELRDIINSAGNTWSQEPFANCYEPTLLPVCGNGVLEGLEECDDGNVSDDDCCSGSCQNINEGCGDGFACGADICEGDDLRGESCDTIGFDGGILDCSPSCDWNTNQCFDNPVECQDVLSYPDFPNGGRDDPNAPFFSDGEVIGKFCPDPSGEEFCAVVGVNDLCVRCDETPGETPIGCDCNTGECGTGLVCRAGQCQPSAQPLLWQCGADCVEVRGFRGYCHESRGPTNANGGQAFCADWGCVAGDVEECRDSVDTVAFMICDGAGGCVIQCDPTAGTDECNESPLNYPSEYSCTSVGATDPAHGLCIPPWP